MVKTADLLRRLCLPASRSDPGVTAHATTLRTMPEALSKRYGLYEPPQHPGQVQLASPSIAEMALEWQLKA